MSSRLEHMNIIDQALVSNLLNAQFPQYASLEVRPTAVSGWDNRSFHLGRDYIARLPSADAYAPQVAKENQWLPKLAPHLPVAIPEPIALGKPGFGYPFNWSIYKWIPGVDAHQAAINNKRQFASDLSVFLTALHAINAKGAPAPGSDNFFRGGAVDHYDDQARTAITLLTDDYDPKTMARIWEAGLGSKWQGAPVWVHGDFAAGNLLVAEGRLCGVIDFGLLAAGDPACDLAIAWTFLNEDARGVFRSNLLTDNETWRRGRNWALWKALIVLAGISETNAVEKATAKTTISQILDDHTSNSV